MININSDLGGNYERRAQGISVYAVCCLYAAGSREVIMIGEILHIIEGSSSQLSKAEAKPFVFYLLAQGYTKSELLELALEDSIHLAVDCCLLTDHKAPSNETWSLRRP